MLEHVLGVDGLVMVSLISVADRLISLGVKIRPVGLRNVLFSFFFVLYLQRNRLKNIFSQLRMPVSLVSGVEKTSGKTIRVLFVSRQRFPLFLKDMLFINTPYIKQIGMVFVWRLHKLDSFLSCDVDAVLVSCDRFYRRWLKKRDFFMFPYLVDMVLDCSKRVEEIMHNLSRDAKKEIQTVKKKKFSFEITTDIEKVSLFYNEMYLPMLKNRIGNTDMFTPDFLTLRFFMQMGCELMLVLLDGAYVCGSFFHHHNKILEVKYFGMSQGDIDLYKKRVSVANQYFLIRVALERKISRLDFGGARPFFNDGLFYYKQKWGTSVESYPLVPGVLGLKICNDAAMKQFLLRNPFIGLSCEDSFVGMVFVGDEDIDEALKARFIKRYKTPGIKELRFIKV